MPLAVISNAHQPRRRRRIPIVDEYQHALEQLELQSQYPGRPPPPELPQSEYSPWPSVYDEDG